MIEFTNMEVAGLIPDFLDEADPRSAVEQIHENYNHGGGWRDFKGYELSGGTNAGAIGILCSINYPGDPPVYEVSRAKLRDETLILFQHQWLAVIQVDGSYRISRLD